MTDKPYSRIKWETVRKRYGKKMMRTMQRLSAEIGRELPELRPSEAWEMDADNYWVVVTLNPEGKERVDVSFEIVESQDYEGVTGGYTFRLGIVAEGGRMIGECSPYNYTDSVWCKTLGEIAERYQMIEDAIRNTTVEYLAGVEYAPA